MNALMLQLFATQSVFLATLPTRVSALEAVRPDSYPPRVPPRVGVCKAQAGPLLTTPHPSVNCSVQCKSCSADPNDCQECSTGYSNPPTCGTFPAVVSVLFLPTKMWESCLAFVPCEVQCQGCAADDKARCTSCAEGYSGAPTCTRM